MAENEKKPPKQRWSPGMLLLMTLAFLGVAVWGVVDGWFRPEYEHPMFSKGVAIAGGILAVIYAVLTAMRWKEVPQAPAEDRSAEPTSEDKPTPPEAQDRG